ncbi:hypothetical protein [Modestobacter sp. SYSU DS0875]
MRDERAPWPEWWLLMAGQGHPVTREQRAALQTAHRVISTFTSRGTLDREVVIFTRAVVRDALHAAPQPINHKWARSSLAIVSGLVDWCFATAQPLTREHVFHPETLHRYLHAGPAAELSDGAIKTYRSRLSVISNALITPPEHLVPRVAGLDSNVTEPHSADEETALWAWSRGLRPVSRRQRIQGALALCLGAGARRHDLWDARARDIVRDDAGVHVTFRPSTRSGGEERTVTCLQAWEDRLWHLAQTTRPDYLIIAPWRARAYDALQTFDKTLRTTSQLNAPTPIIASRLRNTWLRHHLQAGTPLPILLKAAGLSSIAHLSELLDHIPAATPEQASAALRRARA